MFIIGFIITFTLGPAPILLSEFSLPSYELANWYFIAWVALAVTLFFIGMIRKPDDEGHSHASYKFMFGVALAVAIHIVTVQYFSSSAF